MIKQDELVTEYATQQGITKAEAERHIKSLGSMLADLLARNVGNEVVVPHLGKLSVKPVAARSGRNPQTGEPITIDAHYKVVFKASKSLNDAINA